MEELSRCPKCRTYESFLFTSFDECVAYVHCQCQKPKKPERINGKLPLDIAFEKLDQFMKERKNELSK